MNQNNKNLNKKSLWELMSFDTLLSVQARMEPYLCKLMRYGLFPMTLFTGMYLTDIPLLQAINILPSGGQQ